MNRNLSPRTKKTVLVAALAIGCSFGTIALAQQVTPPATPSTISHRQETPRLLLLNGQA
jgi:hypothetical protein